MFVQCGRKASNDYNEQWRTYSDMQSQARKVLLNPSTQFSGSKEAYLDDFAKRFQAAGYTALAYDNRNWFDSEGSPRNEVDPLLQTRDFTTAFNYAAIKSRFWS